MLKLFQRKSLLTLIACMSFVHCGSSTKKNAAAAPAETTVSLADTSKSRAMKVPAENPDAQDGKIPDADVPDVDVTAGKTDKPAVEIKPLILPLEPYEQGKTSQTYISPPPTKTSESAEARAKREAEEAQKRSAAAAEHLKKVEAAIAARDQAEKEAAAKRKTAADAEAEATAKTLQAEADKRAKALEEERAKLKDLEKTEKDLKEKETHSAPADTSATKERVVEPASTQLPNDSLVIKSDSLLVDPSQLPLLTPNVADTSLVAVTDSSTISSKTPEGKDNKPLDVPVDMGGKRMIDVLEDLSESLLTTAPGSDDEKNDISKIRAEFSMGSNFTSLDQRLENIFLMARKNDRFAKSLQEQTSVQKSTAAEASIVGPLWFAFDIQAKAKGKTIDTKLIDIYRDKQQGKSTISISTTHFPLDQWEEKSSRTKESREQLDNFRQVWNALVNSGYPLTSAYPTFVGFSNKASDNMIIPCSLVKQYLIDQDKKAGITNSIYQLFGSSTITTGNYWTSKKQRRVEIVIADVQN